MSGMHADWAALSSEHERLIATADELLDTARARPEQPARWAELASQRERLVQLADPHGRLASPSQNPSGYRLAVRAA
jgi:hypothetical protein